MREEYDFSQSVQNPYAKQLRKPVTIDLGVEVIKYFEEIAEEGEQAKSWSAERSSTLPSFPNRT